MNKKTPYILLISIIVIFTGCISFEAPVIYWEDLQLRFQEFNNIENFSGWNIEHFYAAVGTKEEMLLVIEYSDSLEIKDLNGNTPVMIAQRYNNLSSFDAILSKGCLFSWLDYFFPENKKKALDILSSYGYDVDIDYKSNRKFIPETDITDMAPPDLEYNYFSNIKDYPFNPLNTEFSNQNCWILSECSFLAYVSPFFASLVYYKAGYENFQFIENDDNECMVVWDDDSIIISFRGTEQNSPSSASDVGTDLSFFQVPYEKGGFVHEGFLEAFYSIWNGDDGLEGLLNELNQENSSRAIWITGHSMGGALADICFTHLDSATGLYTFGAPKIGNKDFIDLTNGRPAWRVEHNQDPVPRVPVSIPLINFYYYNLGNLVYIGKYGEVIDMSNTQYNKYNTNYVQTYIEQDRLKVPDHMPINYSIKLWNSIVDSF